MAGLAEEFGAQDDNQRRLIGTDMDQFIDDVAARGFIVADEAARGFIVADAEHAVAEPADAD